MSRLVEKRTVLLLASSLATLMVLIVALAAPDAEAKKKKKKPRPAIPVFYLGVENAVWAVSSLVGDVDGPLLRLVNNGAGANSSGLDVQVEEGNAPLSVNPEAGTATNLDADKVDGKDSTELVGQQGPKGDPGPQGPEGPQGPPGSGLSSDNFYGVLGGAGGVEGEGEFLDATAQCDEGDVVVGGGGGPTNIVQDELKFSSIQNSRTWLVRIKDNDTPDAVDVAIVCADLPPLRSENAAQSEPSQENSEPDDPNQENTGQSDAGR